MSDQREAAGMRPRTGTMLTSLTIDLDRNWGARFAAGWIRADALAGHVRGFYVVAFGIALCVESFGRDRRGLGR